MGTFSDPARVCVLSGRFTPTEFLSSWNHRAYANRHGYTFINCNWPTGAANRYMTKFHFVREYVRHFDFVFWLDDDAFFIDLDRNLEALIPEAGKIASFCKSPSNKEIFTYLSSGQFLLKGGDEGAVFVDAVLSTPLDMVKGWWSDALGMYTKGDQDAIVYLLHEDARFKDGVTLHEYQTFNSRLGDLQADPDGVFLLHFTGSRGRKRSDHTSAMALLNRGPSLLNAEETAKLLSGRSEQSVLAHYPQTGLTKPKVHLAKRIERALRQRFRSKK